MYLHVHGLAPDGTPAFMFEVYLDGKRLERCFEADDTAGYARCYETDENGNIAIDWETKGPKVIEYLGKVEFRRRAAI